jgi:Domain of unknown function (DUF4153)
MMSNDETAPSRAIGLARLGIGLAQGLALYFLTAALDDKTWPATNGLILAPLLAVSFYIPPLAIQALGNLRTRTFVIWIAVATAVLAALATYDVWAAWPLDWTYPAGWEPHVMPSAAFFFLAAIGLFVAHSLILGGDVDRRTMAKYTTHFDVAWKLALQFGLSLVFVGVFWILLRLGAALFALIKLDFFERLIAHRWFAIPATAMAMATAIHVTDVRAGLVRGTRTLVLVLLSWLLPLLALIVAGFLASLPFTGLAPLWKFGHASVLLLGTASALIVLINAAHQDGEHLPPAILRLAGSLASFLLVPLAILAGYALSLRVSQYGWTGDRVITGSIVAVVAFYAASYAVAALPRGIWLKRIETWNFYAALLILAGVLALLTPLANPARVSIADQMARLRDGRTKPASFDFSYLRWSGGRYGRDALALLATDKDAFTREQAHVTLQTKNQYDQPPVSDVALVTRIAVYPKGRTLPASFIRQANAKDGGLDAATQLCLNARSGGCDAIFIDLDGDGRDEILVMDNYLYASEPTVFQDNGKGRWAEIGVLSIAYNCETIRDALRAGKFTLVEPQMKAKDVLVDGLRFHFLSNQDPPACPK